MMRCQHLISSFQKLQFYLTKISANIICITHDTAPLINGRTKILWISEERKGEKNTKRNLSFLKQPLRLDICLRNIFKL